MLAEQIWPCQLCVRTRRKISSFYGAAPDAFVAFAVAHSGLSYLNALPQNEWQAQMAGCSAWVIDYGLKWHQTLGAMMWFLSTTAIPGKVSCQNSHVKLVALRLCVLLVLWVTGRDNLTRHIHICASVLSSKCMPAWESNFIWRVNFSLNLCPCTLLIWSTNIFGCQNGLLLTKLINSWKSSSWTRL